jgi:integrase/recombinase XerD
MPKKIPLTASISATSFLSKIKPKLSDSYISKEGKRKIYLHVFVQGKRVRLNTGVSIDPIHWNDENKEVMNTHPKAKEINAILINCISAVNDILINYSLEKKELTPDQLRTAYENPAKKIDFWGWMEETIKKRKGVLSPSTVTMQLSIITKLQQYKKKVTFSEIDKKFISDVELYCKKTCKNNQNTIHKTLKTIKTYVKIAVERDLIRKNPFIEYTIKKSHVNRVILTEDEIKKLIETFELRRGKPNQLKALQMFLFSYMACGMRMSDVKALEWKNIYKDELITFAPKKSSNVSGKIISIPLSKSALRMARYNNEKKIAGKIFEPLTEQSINRFLKEICTVQKINKNISFHSARHSFATIFLEHNPGDIATLKELMGHSRIEQTMVYVHVDERLKRERMKYMDECF